MSFNPYDDGGPIVVGDHAEPHDGAVDEIRKAIGSDSSGGSSAIFDGSVFDELSKMSPEELMAWAVEHPSFTENYGSYIDNLINQGYNIRNFDFQYAKNNDVSYMMDQLKKAGLNPTLAFRSSLNSGSIGSVQSNYASDLARKASLEETKNQHEAQKQQFIATIFKTLGVAVIGALIAML